MRFRRIDLEAYGAFAGRSLVFRPDARLHVVYGPNEAGKSTALAAIADLLFGFETRTAFAFRHDMKDLRLGATLAAADEQEFAFRRRKGTKNTLIDAADAPLGEDALAPFLGGLTREVFQRAFGLNAEALRAGADDLLAADGEAGATLLAAASGVRGLDDLRKALEAEADGVFAARASDRRRFYQALQRHENARKAIRERELKAGDWKALNARIDELDERFEALRGRRRDGAERRTRLARLARSAPVVRLIDGDLDRLAAQGQLPDADAATLSALAARLKAADAAAAAARRAEAELNAAVEAHDRIAVDETLVAAADEIVRLSEGAGVYAKARLDRPRVEEEADRYAADLRHVAARLGLADAAAVERARPSDAALAQLRGLIDDGRRLEVDAAARAAALAAERARLADLERARGADAAPLDPAPLRERLSALAAELKPLERRDETADACAAETRALREAAARLSPQVSDLDALAARPLPGPEVVTGARREQERLASETVRLDDKLAALRDDRAACDRELAELASGRPIASPAAIAAERDARDAAWRALRGHLLGDALGASEVVDRVAAHERHAAAADRLADDAAEDAGRIARHAAARRRCDALSDAETELVGRSAAARKAVADAQAAWTAVWAPAGVMPAAPEAMAGWLPAVAGLLARRDANAVRAIQVERLDALAGALRPALAELAVEAGAHDVAELAAPALAARIEVRLAALGARFDASRDLETRIRDARARSAQLEAAGAADAQAAEAWGARWQATLPGTRLSPDATLAMAEAALAAWKDARNAVVEAQRSSQRASGLLRDIKAFETKATTAMERLAPDLAGVPADSAAKTLRERLDLARDAHARRSEAASRRDDAAGAARSAEDERVAAAAALAASAAAFPDEPDLAGLLARLAERDAIRTALRERRERLVDQAEGLDEAELRDGLATFDAAEAAAQIAQLLDEDHRFDLELRELHTERDREQRAREALERGVGAEVAAMELKSAEAELAAAARDWTVLKLGALLIGKAVERSRAARQDPLVARASVLFATLTGDAFSGFAEDFDDGDAPTLVGRRASGETVPVSGLSEGTRDQFYLALRLAYLEDYGARAEPAPFIGDDLFASFDDARTACGLKALAEIGATVQPILFTHHRAVADLAAATLGGAADVVELR